MSDFDFKSRGDQLQAELRALVSQVSDLEAAAVVSFDGLPMASLLPDGMNEDRVAAMSAALLSLGEKAAHGLGRGDLSQVYVEGEQGTVFLVACENQAVLVAIASVGAKVGLVLYEVRRTAAALAQILHVEASESSTPIWEAFTTSETEDFSDALADAEAAYEAHRAAAATPITPFAPSYPVSGDSNVYTPHSGLVASAEYGSGANPAAEAQDTPMSAAAGTASTDWYSEVYKPWGASD